PGTGAATSHQKSTIETCLASGLPTPPPTRPVFGTNAIFAPGNGLPTGDRRGTARGVRHERGQFAPSRRGGVLLHPPACDLVRHCRSSSGAGTVRLFGADRTGSRVSGAARIMSGLPTAARGQHDLSESTPESASVLGP